MLFRSIQKKGGGSGTETEEKSVKQEFQLRRRQEKNGSVMEEKVKTQTLLMTCNCPPLLKMIYIQYFIVWALSYLQKQSFV